MTDYKPLRDALLVSYLDALDECVEAESRPHLHKWYGDACELLAAQLDFICLYLRAGNQSAREWEGIRQRLSAYRDWFRRAK